MGARLSGRSEDAVCDVDEEMKKSSVNFKQDGELLAVECFSPAKNFCHVGPRLDEGDDEGVLSCDVVVNHELLQNSSPFVQRGGFSEISANLLASGVTSAENLEDALNFVTRNSKLELFFRVEKIGLERHRGEGRVCGDGSISVLDDVGGRRRSRSDGVQKRRVELISASC